MYVVVRRYTGASKLVEALMQRQAEVTALLTGVPGFRAYFAVDGGGGTVATVTVCDEQSGTEESSRRAAQWVRTNFARAPISPPEITEGEASSF